MELKVEVIKSDRWALPTASTCFLTLKLPSHYVDYNDFARSMEMAIGTTDSGFGMA